jgi:twitching motility two-component system response regulator PilG
VSQVSPRSLIEEGTEAAQAGRKEEARRLLQEATELDPDNETAWLWLARVSATPRGAIICLETVLDINPDNRQAAADLRTALLHAGIAAARAKERAPARRYLTRLTEQDPDNELAWLWLASVSETSHEAMSHLRRVLALNPDNERARLALQRYQKEAEPPPPAWTCPLCGDHAEPNDGLCPRCGAALSLGYVEAFFTGDGADHEAMQYAIDRLAPALKEQPSFDGHLTTALAYLNSKRIAEAIPHLRSALHLKPGDAAFRSQVRAVLQRHAAEEAAAQQRLAEQKARQVTVLCVDDSPTIRKMIALTLEGAGHRVLQAGNGFEAADVLRERGLPDLILLDINMPGMDGYELCRFLRQNESTRRLPIVMLSSKDGFFNKLRGQMAGSTEYMTKPFQPDQLVRVVAKHCAAKTAGKAPAAGT